MSKFKLTDTEKRIVEDTFEVLSIYINTSSIIEKEDNFDSKESYLDYIFSQRYPITAKKLEKLNNINNGLSKKGIRIFIKKNLETDKVYFKITTTKINSLSKLIELFKDNKILIEDIFNILNSGIF